MMIGNEVRIADFPRHVWSRRFAGFVFLCTIALFVALGFKPICALADENGLAIGELQTNEDQLFMQEDATVAMYRLYNPNSGEHFYTASAGERDNLVSKGWRFEGTGWTAPKTSRTPVYRLYNRIGGEHHYTMNAGEKDALVRAGWSYEGVGWYSADSGLCVGLYRQYNPNAFSCNHNFTTSVDEHCMLVGAGWRAEGAAWYGVGPAESSANGWYYTNGSWRYYRSGSAASGWLVVDKPPAIAPTGRGWQRYWISSNKALAVNRLINPSSSLDQGAGYQAFATSGGYIARNTTLELNGSWYNADNDGRLSVDAVVNRLVAMAQGYSSSSRYLIMVDIDNPRTVVFEGSKGRWKVKFIWDCCTGRPSTPTKTGVFKVGIKGYSFGENHGYSCYYYTQFSGNYLFHTRLYYPYSRTLKDATMGQRASDGCVRLYDDDAIWISRNVPAGTTVVTTT